jgi:uncharacterized RDD family membrane protein YckC
MGQPPEGQPNHLPEVILAKWSTRFWAWLVDFIIVTVAAEIIFALAYAPLGFYQRADENPALGATRYAIQSLMFFAYWTYFESQTGQSIGKKLLKVKTVNLSGGLADARNIAIQSLGKAFLLPIDVILGWIFTNERRQRLLGKAANTIVIKAPDDVEASARYRKE